MAGRNGLDPRQKPPGFIRSTYKYYAKLKLEEIGTDANVVDFVRGFNEEQHRTISKIGAVTGYTPKTPCSLLGGQKSLQYQALENGPVPIYEHDGLPGLHLIPGLLSQKTQRNLSSLLMHGVLADQRHKTNVHLHYQVPYHAIHGKKQDIHAFEQTPSNDPNSKEISFFNMSQVSTDLFMPIDPHLHKPITISQFLHKKLRWLTLGGQYDWTAKEYPAEQPPAFPEEIAAFIGALFPGMKPEAAILNIYTPGDTLSIHRDVSEESDKGLVSISIGCDSLFVVGLEDGSDDSQRHLTIRLRSGDAVFMSGPSRFAWHGVPRIIPDSCPWWLKDWPANPSPIAHDECLSSKYEEWRGWMTSKRINLNVRQMKD